MSISREAKWAAIAAHNKARLDELGSGDAMEAALTAALHFLAPQPTGSDEFNVKMILRACEISLEDLEMLEGDILDLVVKARAEERAAHATQLAALREALLAYDNPKSCDFRDYSDIARAALEMSGGVVDG